MEVSLDRPSEPFKDGRGKWRTKSLFVEYELDNYPSFFTLDEYDKNGKVSLKRKYLEIADPTEYEFAIKVFGSWEGWQYIQDSWELKPYIAEWREELRLKLESLATLGIRRVAEDPTHNNHVAACRWIHEHFSANKQKVGRRKKADTTATPDNVSLMDDYKRITNGTNGA